MAALKIGVIGMGMVGGPLAALWAQAGHEVFVSSRHPERLTAPSGGWKGSVVEAVQFADILLLAIPLSSVPHLDPELKRLMEGKIVLDATNAWKGREGAAAAEVHAAGQGSGVWTAKQLGKARVVKAFNTWPFFRYGQFAALPLPRKPAVPLAADDADALSVAVRLVRDAQMLPVVAPGGLEAAAAFDVEQPAGPLSMLNQQALAETLGCAKEEL